MVAHTYSQWYPQWHILYSRKQIFFIFLMKITSRQQTNWQYCEIVLHFHQRLFITFYHHLIPFEYQNANYIYLRNDPNGLVAVHIFCWFCCWCCCVVCLLFPIVQCPFVSIRYDYLLLLYYIFIYGIVMDSIAKASQIHVTMSVEQRTEANIKNKIAIYIHTVKLTSSRAVFVLHPSLFLSQQCIA